MAELDCYLLVLEWFTLVGRRKARANVRRIEADNRAPASLPELARLPAHVTVFDNGVFFSYALNEASFDYSDAELARDCDALWASDCPGGVPDTVRGLLDHDAVHDPVAAGALARALGAVGRFYYEVDSDVQRELDARGMVRDSSLSEVFLGVAPAPRAVNVSSDYTAAFDRFAVGTSKLPRRGAASGSAGLRVPSRTSDFWIFLRLHAGRCAEPSDAVDGLPAAFHAFAVDTQQLYTFRLEEGLPGATRARRARLSELLVATQRWANPLDLARERLAAVDTYRELFTLTHLFYRYSAAPVPAELPAGLSAGFVTFKLVASHLNHAVGSKRTAESAGLVAPAAKRPAQAMVADDDYPDMLCVTPPPREPAQADTSAQDPGDNWAFLLCPETVPVVVATPPADPSPSVWFWDATAPSDGFALPPLHPQACTPPSTRYRLGTVSYDSPDRPVSINVGSLLRAGRDRYATP